MRLRLRLKPASARGEHDTVSKPGVGDFETASRRIVHGREDRSATILKTLKADAEAYLGEPVTHAVVAVPSCELS